MGDLGSLGQSAHRGWVRRKLAALYPQMADQPLIEGWHGRIAMTSDHIPKITEIGPGTVFGRMMAEGLLTGESTRLPLPPVPDYNESWTGLRRAFFETGAALTHLIKARF